MSARLASVWILAAAICPSASVSLPATDERPRVTAQVMPDYAFDLLRDHIEGAVRVSFNITPEGKVADAVVVSSTSRVFEEPTLSAVRQCKFSPVLKEGVAVSTPVSQLITFTLTGRNSAENTAALVARLQPRSSAGNSAHIVASNK